MMRFTEKRKRRFNYVLFSFMIICLTPLCEKGRTLSGAGMQNAFSGKELTCVIDLENDMYDRHGLKSGFSYELLTLFASDNKCYVRIVIPSGNENYHDSLKNGSIDILVTSSKDTLIEKSANARKLDRHTFWAVNDKKVREARCLDTWMSHIKGSDGYSDMQRKYFRAMNPHKRAEKGIVSKFVSPYDDLFKEYSKELGWDWRMLAAVVYQESRFSINTVSPRGATGLMQVMPQTANTYGIDDLFDPEKNLKAGTMHMKRLQNMMSRHGMENEELIKFTLAAYNAGEGRIADCRRFAAANGADSNQWNEIVALIPKMREDAILANKDIRLGKFHGSETISYVENVMSLYDSICRIHPEN